MPEIGNWLSLFYMEDKTEIRKNIQILALDNLIISYTDALEDKEINLTKEERELALLIIQEAREMLSDISSEVNNPIPRPRW